MTLISFGGTLDWLNRNAAAVQAMVAAFTAVVTVVLAVLTGWYVRLTHHLLMDAREVREAERLRARQAASALAYRLAATVDRLPERFDLDESRRNLSWTPDDERDLAAYGQTAGPVEGRAAREAQLALASLRAIIRAVADRARRQSVVAATPSEEKKWTEGLATAKAALVALRDADPSRGGSDSPRPIFIGRA